MINLHEIVSDAVPDVTMVETHNVRKYLANVKLLFCFIFVHGSIYPYQQSDHTTKSSSHLLHIEVLSETYSPEGGGGGGVLGEFSTLC